MSGASLIETLLDSEGLAQYLAISRRALYHALEKGQLPPPMKIGNRLRWRRADIERWLNDLHQAEADHWVGG